ncbi:DUF3570 domain-containing protein [Aliikangiella coralliicola]|uniref:DUF3570 domain-containing protein n=1 Tax=Aliikangiella coralliicola TaxID=2592383 RepID=A0A545U684_9GAMM|nr:DUF3570 domain-containing protein [Aliikangiella coralliicola]TQV84985.1 DUF3570 domain-containing protein [Aliikangiella coralliicola]
MQLKKRRKFSIADKLAVAATALVGSSVNAEAEEDEWSFVGSILVYDEPDRVKAVEALLLAEKNYDETAKLTYKVVLDTLTGASANGAIAQNQIQTFTRPSGNGQYTIAPRETPLDDTFRDTRAQLNLSWSDVLGEDDRYTVGTNLSREYDYHSITVSGEYAKDFDRKNTTLSVGASFAFDSVLPEGGRPLAFSSMVINQGQFANDAAFRNAFNATRIDGDGSIDTAELLLGWTQIVNRRTIVQFNYSFADMSGYLTDPFKVLSVVNNNAISQDYVYENRPDSRTQHTLFGLVKHHLEESVLDFSYRFLTDDWEIDSHTLDFRWHFFSRDNTFWEPHIRFYQQSAADFYRPYLVENEALPEYASADYRVGEMTAWTLGLKYGFTINGGKRSEVRVEYYKQMPEASGAEVVAAAESLDLYPEVDAMTVLFTYFFQ